MTIVFLIAAVLLVAFGGLMAAVDSALFTLSRSDIQDLAPGSRSARALEALAADPAGHTNVINFVRVIAETAAAVLVTLAFTQIFEQIWLTLIAAALIMAAVSFVLVGVSPRTVGRVHAPRIIRLSAGLVHQLRVWLGPVATGLAVLGKRVTPGVARLSTFSSEEQLLSMVDEATELEVLEDEDRELIHSIFEFSDTVVREVMIPRTDMVTLDATARIGTAMGLFLSRGVSRIPLVQGEADEVVGVLYLRDVARHVHERPAESQEPPLGELARAVMFVPESMKADALLRQMQRESNHLAMVVDEYGGIAGLVTLEDLIEELVGDISDEYDRAIVEVERLDDERFRVSVRLPIDELGELFDLELEDEDVDTVGGLLAKALGRLPEQGSVARISGLVLTADRAEGRRRRISTVVVERDTSLAEAEDAFLRDPAGDDTAAIAPHEGEDHHA